jgi:hypothetical protein
MRILINNPVLMKFFFKKVKFYLEQTTCGGAKPSKSRPFELVNKQKNE